MANIIDMASEFYHTHKTGIRRVMFGVGVASTIAAPIAASAATSKVKKKAEELGVTSRADMIKIASKEPLVYVAAGTTILSLGCGAAAYGIGNSIMKSSEKTIEKLVDNIDTTNEVIKTLPEKDQKKIEKQVVEKKMAKALQTSDIAYAEPSNPQNGDYQFIDGWTGVTFWSTFNTVSAKVNEFNEKMNNGYRMTHAHWLLLNGATPRSQDWDFVYDENIHILKDDDHFYKMDTSNGRPVGWIEFTREPRHRRDGEVVDII